MIINSIIAGAGEAQEQTYQPTWTIYRVNSSTGNMTYDTTRISCRTFVNGIKISLSDKTNYEMAIYAYDCNTTSTSTYLGQWDFENQSFSSSSTYIFSTDDVDFTNYFANNSIDRNRFLLRVMIRNKIDPTAKINASVGNDVCVIKTS